MRRPHTGRPFTSTEPAVKLTGLSCWGRPSTQCIEDAQTSTGPKRQAQPQSNASLQSRSSKAPDATSPDMDEAAAGLALRRGTTIKGLARFLDGGGVIGNDDGQVRKGMEGSYMAHGSTVTFFADDRGNQPVNVLPYVAGAISYTPMNGLQTISGPFTGCTMAVYNHSGETRVGHVDTAEPSTGEAPSKQRWASMKRSGNLELADELATKGMIGEFLDRNEPDPSLASLSVLCVATPVVGISSHYVVKKDGDYLVVG